MLLNDIEIDQRNIFKTCSGERLRDHPAYASGADDACPQSHEICLTFIAPGRHGANLLFSGPGHRCESVHEGYAEAVSHHAGRSTPGHRIRARRGAFPEPRAPCAVAGQREPNKGQTRCAKYRSRIALLGGNVIPAQTLATAAQRMAVQQGQPGSGRRRLGHGALQKARLKARIAMHIALSLARKNQPLDECGSAGLPSAAAPQAEADILLPVGPQQMPARQPIDLSCHGNAALHTAHCESQSRQTWLM